VSRCSHNTGGTSSPPSSLAAVVPSTTTDKAPTGTEIATATSRFADLPTRRVRFIGEGTASPNVIRGCSSQRETLPDRMLPPRRPGSAPAPGRHHALLSSNFDARSASKFATPDFPSAIRTKSSTLPLASRRPEQRRRRAVGAAEPKCRRTLAYGECALAWSGRASGADAASSASASDSSASGVFVKITRVLLRDPHLRFLAQRRPLPFSPFGINGRRCAERASDCI
jgi:hypothetical protein